MRFWCAVVQEAKFGAPEAAPPLPYWELRGEGGTVAEGLGFRVQD